MIGVSGMRGTVGGTLTPLVVSNMAGAFAAWLKRSRNPASGSHLRVVFGRDSRPSGPWVRDAAAAALVAAGATRIDVVPLFLGTGGHLRQDLPPLVDALRAAHPAVDFHLHAAIGEHAVVVEAMAAAAVAAAGLGE